MKGMTSEWWKRVKMNLDWWNDIRMNGMTPECWNKTIDNIVKWHWNEEEKNLRGWPLFKILPRGSVYPSFKIGFIQSKVTISWSLVGGIRFFLIYSHQKWWNESGMGVKKLNSHKNISHAFLIPLFLEASSQSPHHPLQRVMGGLGSFSIENYLWYHSWLITNHSEAFM